MTTRISRILQTEYAAINCRQLHLRISQSLSLRGKASRTSQGKTRYPRTRPSSGYATYIPIHHFKVWLQYFWQVPLFQPGARCTRPQCERGSHRIRRHDAQVRLLAGDLAKAARHPIVEERPLGRHRERPDIRALGRTGGTDLFDVTICNPLSQAQIRDAVQNPLNILKAARAGKDSRYAAMVHEAGRSVQLLPVPISTLGGWHPDAHRAVCSVATTIAARGMSTFSSAKRILFQRHAALLVTNMLFASCQVYCRAFEEELTVPLKYLSLFITQVNFLGEAGERNFLILLFPERNFLMLLFATLSARQGCGM